MTWYYDIAADKSSMDIYDRDGNLDRTIQNDGAGLQPKESVLQAIEEAALEEYQANGFSGQLLQLLRDGIFENIEEGTPN
jgi:hypothetical protein